VERIGVLGGSFDPPHRGHLALAGAAWQQLRLDKVLWAPAGQPPHKREQTPIHHRLAMTQLAIAGRPPFILCRLDLERPGPHYTADLLDLLRAQYGRRAAFWFLLGADSLRDLAGWHAPERILSACRLAVYPRPGVQVDWKSLEQLVPGVANRLDWLEGPAIKLSSSLIRQGLPPGKQVPPAVRRYIQTHQLYPTRKINLPETGIN